MYVGSVHACFCCVVWFGILRCPTATAGIVSGLLTRRWDETSQLVVFLQGCLLVEYGP